MAQVPDRDLSWSLIARAAAGEGAARSSFGRTYLPVVRGFLQTRWRGTRLESEVEDAVQEVFVECLREDGALAKADAQRGDMGGLLYGVTRNVAGRVEARLRRQHERDEVLGSQIAEVQAREPTMSRVFDREWARTLLALAGERMRLIAECGDLAARRRVEMLELRFGEGLSVREIGSRWGIEPEAARKAYARAREEFRTCLRRVVAEHAVRSEESLDGEVDRVLQIFGA